MRMIRNQKGLTVMEIMVAIVLSSILIVGIGRMFSFNLNIFGKLDEMTDVQSEMRFIMEDIERKVGTATEVELMNSPGSVSGEDCYIFKSTTDGKVVLMHRTSTGDHYFGGGQGIDGFDMEVIYKLQDNSEKNIIIVTLTGPNSTSLTQEIFLQNIHDIEDTIGEVDQIYKVIRYIPATP